MNHSFIANVWRFNLVACLASPAYGRVFCLFVCLFVFLLPYTSLAEIRACLQSIHLAAMFNKQDRNKQTKMMGAAWPSGQGVGFEICSPTLTTSWICSRQSLVQLLYCACTQPTGLPPASWDFYLLSLFELLAGLDQPLGCHNPTCLTEKYIYVCEQKYILHYATHKNTAGLYLHAVTEACIGKFYLDLLEKAFKANKYCVDFVIFVHSRRDRQFLKLMRTVFSTEIQKLDT